MLTETNTFTRIEKLPHCGQICGVLQLEPSLACVLLVMLNTCEEGIFLL